MKKKEKTLLSNIANLFVIQGLNYLLPFLALPFLFRTLGATLYGVVATSYSFFTFCNILIDFGYNLSTTREISMNIDSKERIDQIVSTTLVSKICLTFLCLIGSAIIIESIPNYQKYDNVFYLMMGIPIANCFFPIWFFQGVEKMGYMTLTTTLSKILSFIPMFIFVRDESDISLVAILYSLGYIFSSIISMSMLKLKFHVNFVKTSFKNIVSSLKNSAPFFMSRVAASWFSLGNTLILGATCGSQMAGFYDVAQKLLEAFNGLIAPVTQALYPYMIKTRNVVVFKIILEIGAAIGVIAFAVCMLFGDLILNILFGEVGAFTINTFKIICICTLFTIPNYLLGYPFLAAMGHINFTNFTVILQGAVYLIILLLLFALGFINIYPLAVLFVSCQFLGFLFRIYGVHKYKLFKVV